MDWKKIFIDLRAIKYDPAKLYLRQLENTLDLTKWINDGITEGEIIVGGIQSLNALTGATQTFATGTSGTNFSISSTGTTHTFNIPVASSTNTGKLSNTDWTTFNSKLGDANNGLTPTLLKEVQLGGALTKDTTISGSFNLNFTNSKIGVGISSPSCKLDVVETFSTNIIVAKFGIGITNSNITFQHGSTNDETYINIGSDFSLRRNGGSNPSIRSSSVIETVSPSLYVKPFSGNSGTINIQAVNPSSGGRGRISATNSADSVLNIGNVYDPGSGEFTYAQSNIFRNGRVLIADTNTESLDGFAILELNSTTRAFLLPRMTTVQKNAITATKGMLVYDSTTDKFCGYNGTWIDLH